MFLKFFLYSFIMQYIVTVMKHDPSFFNDRAYWPPTFYQMASVTKTLPSPHSEQNCWYDMLSSTEIL